MKYNIDSANKYVLKSETYLSQQFKDKDLKKFHKPDGMQRM